MSSAERRRSHANARLARTLARIAPRVFGRRLRRPVFLLGSGRSGTTMLRRILATHRDIAGYPTEANDLWHPRLYPWHESELSTVPIWVDPYRFTRVSLVAWPPNWGRYVRAVFGAYQSLHGGPVFLNKSVMINFMLPEIARDYPEARFIHLYRNGLAVALSYPQKERDKFTVNSRYVDAGIPLEEENLYEYFASYWNVTIQEIEEQKAALRLTEEGRILEVEYEALCSDPREHLGRILEFLDLDPEAYDQGQLASIRSMNFRFAQVFSAPLRERLISIAKPSLELKGYLPEPT